MNTTQNQQTQQFTLILEVVEEAFKQQQENLQLYGFLFVIADDIQAKIIEMLYMRLSNEGVKDFNKSNFQNILFGILVQTYNTICLFKQFNIDYFTLKEIYKLSINETLNSLFLYGLYNLSDQTHKNHLYYDLIKQPYQNPSEQQKEVLWQSEKSPPLEEIKVEEPIVEDFHDIKLPKIKI